MSTKHTPGPWKLETARTSSGVCHKIGEFKRGDKITYGCVYDDYASPHNPESVALLANARLMAAAPDLLEALIDLEEAARFAVIPNKRDYDEVGTALTKACAAITKARGQ